MIILDRPSIDHQPSTMIARHSHPHPQQQVNGVAAMVLKSQFQLAEPIRNASMYYTRRQYFCNERSTWLNTILHYSMHALSPFHLVD